MNPWNPEDLQFNEHAFGGVARLFPLPDVVLYPHVVQPLHIFEERYREMTADALAGDRLIALAMLSPGWEPDYPSRPAVEPIACLGKIITQHQFEDGRYNLLLLGLRRVRIIHEISPPRAYRQATVEILPEQDVEVETGEHRKLRKSLVKGFKQGLATADAPPGLEHLLEDTFPLGALTDLIAFALKLPAPLKQQLLAEPNAVTRAELLVAAMRSGSSPTKPFPPPFSAN